ncbi:MAG: hypothetical protein IMZ66_00565, partial [Planctomycetes bacterium]|nr:hypothetical protein [Planctomycetota bacterium]
MARLFRYAVMGEKDLADGERKDLMRMVVSQVPRGAAQWLNVVRYDVLYDVLSARERRACEDAFRAYIDHHVVRRLIFDPTVFNDSRQYSRYDAREYTRTNWLPNIIWPWKVSANLMAVVLKDEALIRKTWAAYGSWQWYFDAYLCDTGFYAEEFSKMGSTPGAMLVYGTGLERLGLGDLGFGYRGKGGATLDGHIESLLHLGYPRVDVGSDRPHYPMVTIGDLRQGGSSQRGTFGGDAFQHSLVRGYLADGAGGNELWQVHGAWGGTVRGQNAQWDGYSGFTPKMQMPLWFEMAHRRRPHAGFDYFLAQMRGPGEAVYTPSLYFGLDPVDPKQVKPPPAPSAVWPERGLAMLRAEEGPVYWESPAPAVCMRLATDYAHNVNDAFVLAGFYAFNRPIYLNRQTCRSYAQGYSRSVLSHAGVMVDLTEPQFTDRTTVRSGFDAAAKFVAARSSAVYPGVDLTRALVLTREYLLDVVRLAGDRPHACHWLVHTLGQVVPGDPQPWAESRELTDVLYGAVGDRGPAEVRGERRLDAADRPWSVTTLQACALDDPARTRVGRAWYDRLVGVRVSMLGAPGTVAYVHRTPEQESRRPNRNEPPIPPEPNEFGGVTIVAARHVAATAFVALHEPFERGAVRVAEFRRIAETPDAVAVAVVGKAASGIDDRVMIRFGDAAAEPVTLEGGGERFTFADRAYVRIAKDRVEVSGDLRAMTLKVAGRPALVLNGKECPAAVKGGVLTFAPAP